MSELDAALERLRGHAGVEHLVLLGRDGLVVQQSGGAGEAEAIAARVPGLAAAAQAIGRAASRGGFATAVLEFRDGVAIVVNLSDELFLTAFLRPGVGFSALLRELRHERDSLLDLL